MRRPGFLVAFLFSSALFGCSDHPKGRDGAAGDGAADGSANRDVLIASSAGTFVIDFIRSECELETRCGGYPDQLTCERHLLYDKHAAQGALDIDYAVSMGRARYHPENGAACLEAFSFLPCSRTAAAQEDPDVPCALVFEGTLAEGAACLTGAECMSGQCNLVPCVISGSCCVSQCTGRSIPQPLGSACDWACVPEAYCDRSSQPGTCRPRPGAGETCRSADDCVPGLACVPDDDPRACLPYVPDGQACNSGGAPCDNPQSYCAPASGTCIRRGKPGDACSESAPCVAFATCVAGICQPLPKEGEPCVPDAGASGRCLAGACMEGRCTVPPAPAEPCVLPPDGGA